MYRMWEKSRAKVVDENPNEIDGKTHVERCEFSYGSYQAYRNL